MKDYSLNIFEQKRYILSYQIKKGKIIAKLASGEIYTIPYTEKNEQLVISKMEKQAKQAHVKPILTIDKVLSITQPAILPLAISIFINNGGWLYGIVLAVVAIGAVKYPTQRIIHAIKERDIKKMNYFLEHKQELNDNFVDSKNMLLGVSKKAANEIKLQQETSDKSDKIFNINSIDNYSLNDLKMLRENLRRISSFGFDEKNEILSNSSQEEQGPILKKTMK